MVNQKDAHKALNELDDEFLEVLSDVDALLLLLKEAECEEDDNWVVVELKQLQGVVDYAVQKATETSKKAARLIKSLEAQRK